MRAFTILLILFFLTIPAISAQENALRKIQYLEKDFDLLLHSRKFAQGEVILLNYKAKSKKKDPEIYWNDKKIFLTKKNDSLIGFIAVHPEYKKDQAKLSVKIKAFFKSEVFEYTPSISKTTFKETAALKLDSKFTSQNYSKQILDFIEECTKAKNKAFQKFREMKISGNFDYPVKNTKINSNFYARRTYNGKKGSPHRGIDLKGKKGDPIYAIQEGKVELARKMYFEGNLTIINHGNRLYSLYMHQSKTLVKEGDYVKKGELIGKIGSTGMSTGPHLHLAVKLNGIYVDPVSLISLNIL